MSQKIRVFNAIKRKIFHRLGLRFRDNYFIDAFYEKDARAEVLKIGDHAGAENVFLTCSDSTEIQKVYSFPKRYIYDIKNASIWVPDNLIYSSSGKLIAESTALSVYRLLWEVPLPEFKAKKYLSGQHVYLAVNENYYHWLLEDLPVFITAHKLKPEAKIIAKKTQFRPALDFLEKFFPGCYALVDDNVKCESLVMAAKTGGMGAPHDHGVVHPKDVKIVREWFSDYIPPKTQRRKKVYVSRVGRRRSPEGEEKLVSRLKAEGFEIFDGSMGLFEQIDYFQDVEVLVGASGAALTNILWMAPGSKVVKLALDGERLHFFSDLAFYCDVTLHNIDVPSGAWNDSIRESIEAQLKSMGFWGRRF